MKFEIANIGESKKEETIVRFGLEKEYDGTVNLVVLDEHGCVEENGRLLDIGSNGVFYRVGGVSPGLGFPLNANDEIIVV